MTRRSRFKQCEGFAFTMVKDGAAPATACRVVVVAEEVACRDSVSQDSKVWIAMQGATVPSARQQSQKSSGPWPTNLSIGLWLGAPRNSASATESGVESQNRTEAPPPDAVAFL